MNVPRFVKPLGTLIVLASLAFIVERLWANREWLAAWRPDAVTLVAVSMGILFYGFGSVLLSAAWTRLLAWCGQPDARFAACHAVYGRTQLAKYLPGNVFQYVGRQVLGREAGLSQLPMASASIYEILAFLLAAGLLGVLGMGLLGISTGNQLSSAKLGLVLVAAAGALIAFSLLAPRAARLAGADLRLGNTKQVLTELLPAFAAYAGFVLLVGLTLAGLVHASFGLSSFDQLGAVVSGFAVAWVAGFITPGAPGGLGVREAVMLVFLLPIIGESEGLVVTVIFRVMTILGDVLFFITAYWFGRLPQRGNTN